MPGISAFRNTIPLGLLNCENSTVQSARLTIQLLLLRVGFVET
jgi:hypothetical protein